MKKTAVIGLGIIGASICRSLTRAGFFVAGNDLNEKTLDYAMKSQFIQEKAEHIEEYDAVFLAVPPRAAVDYLENGNFGTNALVADICGVKTVLEKAVYACRRPYRYIGLHPMAGKETGGVLSSSADLFTGANLVITVAPQTEQSAITEAREYASAMRFGRITECTAEEHDKKIALTSQLAHILSNAYVKSPSVNNCEGFTGGSFQDMTRIAGVDEFIWSQLYLLNRENILDELDGLISNLSAYRAAIADGNEEALSAQLRAGRILREKIKRKKI